MVVLALAFSYHVAGEEYDFNYIHPHVSYNTESDWVAGGYYNSECNFSAYVGKKLQYEEDWGLEVGLVTGYYSTVLPYARVTYQDIFVAPTVYDKDELGLVVGYEFKLR